MARMGTVAIGLLVTLIAVLGICMVIVINQNSQLKAVNQVLWEVSVRGCCHVDGIAWRDIKGIVQH